MTDDERAQAARDNCRTTIAQLTRLEQQAVPSLAKAERAAAGACFRNVTTILNRKVR